MKMCKSILSVVLAAFCLSSAASAAALIEETQLVAKSPALESIAPAAQTLTVTTAGKYSVTLSDVGFPAPLSSAQLVIVKGIDVVFRMSQFGVQEFDATPGTYVVRVSGKGPSAGTLSASIALGSAQPLLVFQSGIAAEQTAADPNRSTLATSFTVPQSGLYQIDLTDRNFPAAAATIDVLVVAKTGVPVARVCIPAAPPACSGHSATFSATAGEYDLFQNALAATTEGAALYSVRIEGSSIVFAATQAVGKLKPLAELQFPSSGAATIQVSDLQFPKALAAIASAIAQKDSAIIGNGTAEQSFPVTQGAATLFVLAKAQTSSSVGTFGVTVNLAGVGIYENALPVAGTTLGDSAVNDKTYGFSVPVATGGTYELKATDFAFPSSIPSLQIVAVQKGNRLGSLNAAGTTSVQAEAGTLTLLAIANMLSNATTGLFAVTVAAPASTQPIFAATQGVGDLFHTRSITVSENKSLALSAADLGFPAAFADFALTVTREHTLVGQIFGAGKFSFDVAPGVYSLNFIARSADSQNYGLYAIKLEDAPAAPDVVLNATPNAIAAGGNTSVNWNATGATSCVASGDWSGVKETSGTNASVGPFSSKATLTLTCTGPGGSSSAAATVSIIDASQNSGGGSLGIEVLAALLLLLARRSLR